MTTAMPTQPTRPLTTSAFLFGGAQDPGQALAHALREQGVLGPLGPALRALSHTGREAAGSQIATVAHELLDFDLGELAVGGWRKHAALTAAADRTRVNPGSSEVVDLATHRITSVHRPYVELLLNDVHIATVRFELRVLFLVRALVATVRDGHVAALGVGACDVTGTLAAEGVQLVKQQARLDMSLLIPVPVALHRHDGDSPPDGDEHRPVPSPSLRATPSTSRRSMGRPRRRQRAGWSPPAQ
jgi:hypothetical protein